MSNPNNEKADELKGDARDYAVSGIKAALGMIPFAGSLLSEIAGNVIPQQRVDRIADFAERLEIRISHLEEAAVRNEINDEEFTDLVEESLRQAARSTSPQRREYLAYLVANSLAKEAVEHSESRHLMNLLGELSDIEIIWLRFYLDATLGGDSEFREKHDHILAPVPAHRGSSQDERDKSALQKSYKDHLERLGLISGKVKTDKAKSPEFDASRGEFKRHSYQTTSLGRLLLRSIGLVEEN